MQTPCVAQQQEVKCEAASYAPPPPPFPTSSLPLLYFEEMKHWKEAKLWHSPLVSWYNTDKEVAKEE